MIHVDARYLGLTANQLAKIATDLKAENAELRDEIDHLLIKRQHTEEANVELREQVDYMTPLALYAASERERDRMRELGIEVPA